MRAASLAASLACALSGAVAASEAMEKRACGADNCIRAVSETRSGSATFYAHIADCTSFMRTTFTPSPV